MLKIQEFIFAHENWRELLAAEPYNLKISEDDGFVLFKYNQIASDFSQEICKEARGLILDTQDNFRVVRYAFHKFFNIGESFAAKIDWDTAIANEKMDGSLMSVWFARGQWHLSTNGVIDAFKAELAGAGPYKTFGELFESVLPLSRFSEFSNILAHQCYTFELCGKWNKVIIDYPETKVYLLSVRDMRTLVEHSLDQVEKFAERFGFTVPQRYSLNNEEDYRQLVASMPEGHEGIVVRDANGERVKIKTLLYFEMHRAKNNGVLTLERIVDLILKNDDEEFLSYFIEYRPKFFHIRNVREKILSRIEEINTLVKNYSSKKEIALDNSIPNWEKRFYFNAFDKRENNLELRDWCKLIEMWEAARNESIE